MKRRFEIEFAYFNGDGEVADTAIVELDQAVFDAVTDEWRSMFYPSLNTPEKIAAHIAYNLVINKWPLSAMDGWADQPDENAKIIKRAHLDDWGASAREIAAV